MTPEQQRSEFKQIYPQCPLLVVGQFNPDANSILTRGYGYKVVEEIKSWKTWYDCVVTFGDVDELGLTLMSRSIKLGGVMILPKICLVPGFIQIYDGGLKAYKKVK